MKACESREGGVERSKKNNKKWDGGKIGREKPKGKEN